MRKEDRLVKPADFKNVFEAKKSWADRYLVLYSLPRPGSNWRVGISVSKKVAGSVGRNRLKRLVREVVRLNRHRISPGHHLVVILRVAAKDIGFAQVQKSLLGLIGRAGLLLDE